MHFNGAIFDMDGTIIDSMHIWRKIGGLFLSSVQITPPDNLGDIIRDFNLHQTAEYLSNVLKIPYTVSEIKELIQNIIYDNYFCHIPTKPGARRFLERLSSNNIKMCVATATDSFLARPALERLDLMKHFEFIITCSDVKSGKDKPKIYIDALNAMGTDISETLVFEDALYAAKTAKSAGFRVIGVYDDSAAGDEAEMRAVCDGYIKDYLEINERTDMYDLLIK